MKEVEAPARTGPERRLHQPSGDVDQIEQRLRDFARHRFHAVQKAGTPCRNRVLLRTAILVWCLSRMPFDTHNPSPVPASPLVVAKGWKRRSSISRSMPEPLSATVTATPWRPAASRRWPNPDHKSAMARQCVQRIADQVGDHLAKFAWMVKHLWSCLVAALQS